MSSKVDAANRELSSKIDDFRDEFALFKGSTNERILREQVKKEYGETFAKRFVVQGLSGLARMVCSPKRDTSPYQPRDSSTHNFDDTESDLQSQQKVVKQFRDKIFTMKAYQIVLQKLLTGLFGPDALVPPQLELISFVSNTKNQEDVTREKSRREEVRKFFNSFHPVSDSTNDGLIAALEKMKAFCLMSSRVQQLQSIDDDSGLGILMFTSIIPDLDDFFPIVDLEFDTRGSFGVLGDNILHICCGEIKSSASGIPKAKDQLMKRLKVVKFGAECLPEYTDMNKLLEGIIFLPHEASIHIDSTNARSSRDFNLKIRFL